MLSLGLNLTSVVHYIPPSVTLDRFEGADDWIGAIGSQDPDGWNAVSTGQGGLGAAFATMEPGDYHIFADYAPEIRWLGGATMLPDSQQGHWKIRITEDSRAAAVTTGAWKDPGTVRYSNLPFAVPAGSPIARNSVKVIKDTDLADYNAGKAWRNEFLQGIGGFRVLRFKDWMCVDGNTATDAPTTFNRSMSKGVSWARIADLCKATGATPWLCVPINASDAYVRALCQFFAAAGFAWFIVELCNEVWNWGFSYQSHQALEASQVMFGSAEIDGVKWYAYRAWQIKQIAKQYGGKVPIGWHPGQPTRWPLLNDGVAKAGGKLSDFDYLMSNAYIGNVLSDAKSPALALATKNDIPGALAAISADITSTLAPTWAGYGKIAADNGLDLVFYEGGQYRLTDAPWAADPATRAKMRAFFDSVQLSSGAADVIDQGLTAFEAAGGKMGCIFASGRARSTSDGLFPILGQPMYDVLQRRLAALPAPIVTPPTSAQLIATIRDAAAQLAAMG